MIADTNATNSIVFKNNEDVIKKMDESVEQYSPDTIIQNSDKFINPLLFPCPVFALNGDVDVQVNADANLGAIKKYVKGNVTTKKYIDLNHLFQYLKTGFELPEEYEKLDETISTKVIDDMSDWILKTTK